MPSRTCLVGRHAGRCFRVRIASAKAALAFCLSRQSCVGAASSTRGGGGVAADDGLEREGTWTPRHVGGLRRRLVTACCVACAARSSAWASGGVCSVRVRVRSVMMGVGVLVVEQHAACFHHGSAPGWLSFLLCCAFFCHAGAATIHPPPPPLLMPLSSRRGASFACTDRRGRCDSGEGMDHRSAGPTERGGSRAEKGACEGGVRASGRRPTRQQRWRPAGCATADRRWRFAVDADKGSGGWRQRWPWRRRRQPRSRARRCPMRGTPFQPAITW